MECYRCENPDCGLALEREPDVCPHCGGPLYVGPRLPTHIPQYCPNCGTKIEPPGGG